MLLVVGIVHCQGQLEPEYLKQTFFAKQNKVAIPDIPSSISEPALAPLAPKLLFIYIYKFSWTTFVGIDTNGML